MLFGMTEAVGIPKATEMNEAIVMAGVCRIVGAMELANAFGITTRKMIYGNTP
jgi:phosphate/sulfate permease